MGLGLWGEVKSGGGGESKIRVKVRGWVLKERR